MDGPVRQKLPLTVSLRVNAFEPDGVQFSRSGFRALGHVKANVTSISDDNIAMDFCLHAVEIVH